MKIQVTITKDILFRTQNCGSEPATCAISKAVKELFPESYTINGHIVTGYDLAIRLPDEAFEWYQSWDKFTPDMRIRLPEFSFEIDIPLNIVNRIGRTTVETIISKSKNLKRISGSLSICYVQSSARNNIRIFYICLMIAWGCALTCVYTMYLKDQNIELLHDLIDILQERIELFENKTHTS